MKTITFKDAIKKLGYTIVKYNKGYNYRSAFVTDKNGQMWYFDIEDLRDSEPHIFRRKVNYKGDYHLHGKKDLFDVESDLLKLGYKVQEKRQKCDYGETRQFSEEEDIEEYIRRNKDVVIKDTIYGHEEYDYDDCTLDLYNKENQ